MTPPITALPTLVAGPGTILATAALTSQEALVAVDQAVFNDPTEAVNFATVTGLFALNLSDAIALEDHEPWRDVIFKYSAALAESVRCRNVVERFFDIRKNLRIVYTRLLGLDASIYESTMERVRQSLSVFQSVAPAVSADPVQAGVAAVVEDHWSDESLLRNIKEEFVASRLLSVAIEGRSDTGAGVLSLLIARAGEGNSAAIEALCKYANAARDGTSSRNFTKDHLAQLEDIIKGSGLERRLVEILLSVRKAIMRVRVDLLPET